MTDLSTIVKSEIVLNEQGLSRRCLVLTDDSRERSRVVVSLHGSGFSADTYAVTSHVQHLAARGAVVVLPQAVIPFRLNPVWRWGVAWNIPNSPLPGEASARQQPDDVAFIRAILAACADRYPGLPVHLTGYSGGARLASYVAATESNLASVGLVAGVRFPTDVTTTPPMAAIHGRRDAINPYAGSNDARWGASVETVVRCWARAAGCLEQPQLRVIEPGVLEQRFVTFNGLSPVRLISLAHIGHAWPGSVDSEHIAQFGDAGTWSASHWLGCFFEEVEADFSVAALRSNI